MVGREDAGVAFPPRAPSSVHNTGGAYGAITGDDSSAKTVDCLCSMVLVRQ